MSRSAKSPTPGVTKDDVRRVHEAHPDWPAPRIAEELGCDPAFVRAMKQRHGWPIPAFDREAYSLGVAAKKIGMTLADIEGIKSTLARTAA